MNAFTQDPIETLNARLAAAEQEILNLRQGYLILHHRHAQALALIEDLKARLAKVDPGYVPAVPAGDSAK